MKNLLIASAAALSAAALAPAFAANQVIEAAKADCIIGEQIDGYLGVVSGKRASADVRRELNSINLQRKAAYKDLAERNGVSIDDAAKLTAENLINRAGPGECVQNASGAWVQR